MGAINVLRSLRVGKPIAGPDEDHYGAAPPSKVTKHPPESPVIGL